MKLTPPYGRTSQELRGTFLRMLAIIGLSVFICFIFYDSIIAALTTPLRQSPEAAELREERLENIRIANPTSEPKTFALPQESLPLDALPDGVEQIAPDTYRLLPGSATPVYEKKPAGLCFGPCLAPWTAFSLP